MKDVTLFIGMSLDGYIADSRGKVDWMQGQESDRSDTETYEDFSRDIDTVIMGWNTYAQIITELSPGEWCYGSMTAYVLTHRKREDEDRDRIHFVNRDVCELVQQLRQGQGKGIWICGGAAAAQPLIRENMIDRFHISVLPIILGGGIRLFGHREEPLALKMTGMKQYNGITDLIYERR